MKGRISPLLRKILDNPESKKKLAEAMITGQPFTHEGKTYRIVTLSQKRSQNK